MRDVDEANTEVQKKRIIVAAAHCLADKGVAATSISDICQKAGMRSGHLYYYFANKDALLEAVLLHNQEQIIESIEAMLDEGDIISQAYEVHAAAERGRQSYGLTPSVRIELQCYFQQRTADQVDQTQTNRVHAALRSATQRAVASGRLAKDLDIETFVDAIALIWQGLTYSRLDRAFDDQRMQRAVQLLVEPWLIGKQCPPS